MTSRDRQAHDMILRHHAELVEGVRDRTSRLHDATTARSGPAVESARSEFVAYFVGEILPHASAEEETLYRAAASAGLEREIDDMLAEHRVLEDGVRELAETGDGDLAAARAAALEEMFRRHVEAENDVVLPVLAANEDPSLADLLDAMHERYTTAKAKAKAEAVSRAPT